MITSTESRDLEEMILGNDIDRIWGSDSESASWDRDEIAQHQEMINAEMEEVYQESRKLFYPDEDPRTLCLCQTSRTFDSNRVINFGMPNNPYGDQGKLA